MNESALPDALVAPDACAPATGGQAELPCALTCEQARLARDPRFDGRFFTAVLTTGIYCRPICPAPPPRPEHVRYYATAAQAFAAGFRPCLRCRPESAPNSPAWRGTETTVRRALMLLQGGVAQHQDLEALSERLGVSSRHLRRLFKQHLGVSPQDYIQHRNLSFAKKLLMETQLPLLDVALASGFNSRRRFNAVFQDRFKLNPGAIRKSENSPPAASAGCVLNLHYRPPYRWPELLDFYRQRAIAGMEIVTTDRYARSFRLNGHKGWYRISALPDKAALRAEIHCDALEALQPLVQVIRRQFDLDANPDLVQKGLCAHPLLRHQIERYPGLRVPGIVGEFEAVVRAIAGQQISVAAARTLLQRLCLRCAPQATSTPNPEVPTLWFPTPQQILATPLDGIGLTNKRLAWIKDIAARYAQGFSAAGRELNEAVTLLQSLPGIGLWSAHYIAMRAFGEPDAFPTGDLGLLNALRDPERPSVRELQQSAEQWRPWRAYATFYLWNSLSVKASE